MTKTGIATAFLSRDREIFNFFKIRDIYRIKIIEFLIYSLRQTDIDYLVGWSPQRLMVFINFTFGIILVKSLKKSIAILLLVSLTAPIVGTYVFLQYNKNKIKKEIAGMIFTGMDKKDLVQLKFTKEEAETNLNWKHAGEFEYKGQMYDIVERYQEGDTTWYNCYKDDKETRLNSEQDLLVARALGQDPVQKSQTEKIMNFFKTVYRSDIFNWKPYSSQATIFHFSFFIFNYSSLSLSPPAPPPKMG